MFKFVEHNLPRLAREKQDSEVISAFLTKMDRTNKKLDNFVKQIVMVFLGAAHWEEEPKQSLLSGLSKPK